MESEGDDNRFIPQVTVGAIPKVGQEFETPDDAQEFYNQYSRLAGFSTRIANSKRNKETGDVAWKLYVCSKEGITDETYQVKIKNTVERSGERKRGHTRCGCKARLSVVKHQTENLWVASMFVEEHNHALCTPSKTHLLRSHRKVSATKKALAQQLSEANIPTCQQIRLMEIDAGGPSSMGYTERDLRNHERDVRKEHLGHDAESLIDHFTMVKQRNPNFYYAYETDKNGVFLRCFWTDCESRSSYAYFGDAVVFDTTYNTNKYSMVFAPFVGVNNHRQTTIFGCGLLSDEKTESFVWLLSQFLQAMPNRAAPKVIITDQDAVISRAISEVFPNTLHKLCLWHILNKFSEKMNVMLFKENYHKLVNIIKTSEAPEEFEHRWTEVMETTKLGDNEWLSSMYEIRQRWVPVYVKHVFAAGMSSSQRSETNHSFLKRYVNRKNSLMDLITRFDRALIHQRREELTAIHVNLTEQPRVTTALMMENQMVQIYTKAIFLLFQDELVQSNFYFCSKNSSSTIGKIYTVQRFEAGKTYDRQRRVTYFNSCDFISCSCQMFDFKGYPCRHMLCLMKKKQVLFLPEKYILTRWTKQAKQTPIFETCASLSHGQSLISRHGLLTHTASELVEEGSLTEARSTFLMAEFQNLKISIQGIDDGGDVGMSRNMSKSREETHVVCDPVPVRTKGCGKRLKSSKEKAMSQSSKKCRMCGTAGHDRRTCPTLQPRLHLVDEPYHPHFLYDCSQDDRFTSIASGTYDDFNDFSGDFP